MKTTLRIAKLELSTLFFSPIAWLVLVIFIFQSGIAFADLFDFFTRMFKLGRPAEFITNRTFADPRMGFFVGVVKNLYLYIPLLTMGLMSRELSSGSVKLLFSSPIKIGEIILGKFLSMAAYGLILVAVLLFFGVAAGFSIEKMDVAQFISGIIGIYLLICAYSAIGLFMSCLTTYQVVAAISTLIVFAALNFIGTIGQGIDFVRDITYFLSIAGRTDEFINGLIKTNDVFYFLIVISIFLGLSYLKLLHGRESKHRLVKVLRYTGFIIAMLLAGYVLSLPSMRGYIDMTATNRRTLTGNSQAIIKKMDKPVKITAYINFLDDLAYLGLPGSINNNKRIFEQFSRFKPGIEVNYVYYYDSVKTDYEDEEDAGKTLEQQAKKKAEAYKFDFGKLLTPVQIRKQVDLSAEENKVVWRVDYNGKHTYLRMFRDMLVIPSEREISAGLKRLMTTPPKIVFVTGHLERNVFKTGDKEYKEAFKTLSFRSALINQGFDIDTVDLATGNIPAGIVALAIIDPRRPFSQAEFTKITGYINGGGNLLVAGKAGRQDMLNPLLQPLGVQMKEGALMQFSKNFPADFIQSQFHKPSPQDSAAYHFFYMEKQIVTMPGSAELQFADTGVFHYAPMLVTSEEAWNRPINVISDSTEAVFDPSKGDVKKQMITALAATRTVSGKEQRIMIVGSADFVSNAEVFRQNIINRNLPFNENIFSWFAGKEFPINVSRPVSKDKSLNIGQSQIIWLRIIFLGVLPGMLAIFAALLLIRRRRQ